MSTSGLQLGCARREADRFHEHHERSVQPTNPGVQGVPKAALCRQLRPSARMADVSFGERQRCCRMLWQRWRMEARGRGQPKPRNSCRFLNVSEMRAMWRAVASRAS